MKRNHILYALTALILLSSCLQNKSKGQIEKTNTNDIIEPTQTDFTIIPFDPDRYWIYENVTPTTLTAYEVQRVEEILKSVVKENNESRTKKSESGFSIKQ